jgi:translocator protein
MTSDRFRQLAILVTFVLTFAANGAANALPLNDQTTGEIADRFRVFVVPAGYVFSIWSLIYIGQIAFLVHTLRPSRLADPLLRRLGLLPALAALLNALWIIFWHYEVFPITLAVMGGLLLTLIAIYMRGDLAVLSRPGSGAPRTDRWLVGIPFSIYLGWISVAFITNVAVVGAWAEVPTLGVAPELIAAVVLVVGLVVATLVLWRTGDVAYGLVIIWAYAGIVVKESAAGTPFVPPVAAVVTLAVAALVVLAFSRLLPVRSSSS